MVCLAIFFSIRWPDRVDSDLLGTLLTDDAAALAHAVRIIESSDKAASMAIAE